MRSAGTGKDRNAGCHVAPSGTTSRRNRVIQLVHVARRTPGDRVPRSAGVPVAPVGTSGGRSPVHRPGRSHSSFLTATVRAGQHAAEAEALFGTLGEQLGIVRRWPPEPHRRRSVTGAGAAAHAGRRLARVLLAAPGRRMVRARPTASARTDDVIAQAGRRGEGKARRSAGRATARGPGRCGGRTVIGRVVGAGNAVPTAPARSRRCRERGVPKRGRPNR